MNVISFHILMKIEIKELIFNAIKDMYVYYDYIIYKKSNIYLHILMIYILIFS